MEGVLMDQSPMNPRRSFPTAVAASNHSYIHGIGSASSPSFPASMSQLFLNVQAGNRVGLFGSRPPPMLYSSPPSFAVAPPPSQQPPLLPLPFSKSAALPSPTKRIPAGVRSRQHKSKSRPSAGARKERGSSNTGRSGPKPVEKPPVPVKPEVGGEDDEEEFLGRSLYSISPPPSSLPLPRFSLSRPRAAAATRSCNVEAVGGGGGRGAGVDGAGASGDLLRLLRL